MNQITKNMKRLVIIISLFLAFAHGKSITYAAETTMGKNDFAFAINCDTEKSKKSCLVGNFRTNIKVTLLQSNPQNNCLVRTTSRREKLEENDGFLTELSGSCELGQEFAIVVLKKPVKDYEKLQLKEVVNIETALKLDKVVRNSKALVTLFKKAQGSIPGELKEYEGITPKIYQASIADLNMFVVCYEASKENNGVPGPRILVINEHAYPLTGWCSYRTLNFFQLEGNYYIQSGSCCCGCGIQIMELFKITSQGPVKILSDSSLSD